MVVKEALTRAAAFMHSDPPGPVSMMLPREVLAEAWDDDAMPAYPPARYGSVRAGGVEPEPAGRRAAGFTGAGVKPGRKPSQGSQSQREA